MYRITTYKSGRVRHHDYPTLEEATAVAGEIFRRTGVVVAIVKVDR